MKMLVPEWHQIFLKAIGALGLDHVIANMFFIPCAIFYDHPDIGVGLYIWKSLVPTLLGNLIGGGFFVGTVYWYLYLTGLNNETIKFDLGSLDTAMEAGGPMGPRKLKAGKGDGLGVSDVESDETKVLEGHVVGVESPKDEVTAVPSTDLQMHSAVGHELRADVYGKPKAEVVSDGGEKV
ncbi:uncharacterized protein KY384_005091 [Bacidia gigantensis]|uniref:uncharacterized protein n=1 Tax=Bacidia gigantensis TaxID=2732470 RepID=UPI001D044487|nr:uncharacterized protein KY384_005091 [Bacidia gigantensis]KAG8530588.1 hypothetical protein KY384_005091 [Bacidia gigantensis]